MNKIFLPFIFIILFFLQSCESAKKGLGGGKLKSSDEFLVEKKDPLVLPPDFDLLPTPGDNTPDTTNDNLEIEKIINVEENDVNSKSITDNSSLEKSILKKIK